MKNAVVAILLRVAPFITEYLPYREEYLSAAANSKSFTLYTLPDELRHPDWGGGVDLTLILNDSPTPILNDRMSYLLYLIESLCYN